MGAPHVELRVGFLSLGLPKHSPVSCQVNDLKAIAGPHAPQHAVNVILYGLLGEIQVRGNFFIRQTLRNQRDQLLLPACQAQFKFNSRAWNGCPLPRNHAE